MSTLKAAVLIVLGFPVLCGVTVLLVTMAGPRSRVPVNPFPTEVGRSGAAGYADLVRAADPINRIHVQFSDSRRFGISCPKLRDPNNPEEPKRLTRDARGITNNTCVRIDGYEYLFGHEIPGIRWARDAKGRVLKDAPIPGKDSGRGWQSAMDIEFQRLHVNQAVQIVVGEQTRLYDTALVTYHLVNQDQVPHTVGLRVMLDTFIGANDGVPFYVPPTEDRPARFVDKLEIMNQKQIPDYLMALETGKLDDPTATLAVLCPKIAGTEPMDKLVLCQWPQNSEARWGGTTAPGDWSFQPMDLNPNARDSCAAMYWAQLVMHPGDRRTLAFTYGLGRMGQDRRGEETWNNRMRLIVGNRAKEGRPITVTALVKSGDAGQTVTLKPPAGLTLLPGESATKPVPPATSAGYAQVTWRVQAAQWGAYVILADAPNIGTVSERVVVRARSLFD